MNKRIRKKIDKLTYRGIYPYLTMSEKKPVTYTTYRKYYNEEKMKTFSYYVRTLNSVKYPALLPYRFKKKAMLKVARAETMKQLRHHLNMCYGYYGTKAVNSYQIMKDQIDTVYHENIRKYILQNYFPIPPHTESNTDIVCCLNPHLPLR